MPTPDAFTDADPAVRAAAVKALRFVQLKDPATLAAVFDLCADDTDLRTEASDDPFAAFFQGDAAQVTATVGHDVIARVDRAGLPRDAWETLARALERHPHHVKLHEAAARWTAETRWTDAAAALTALVPLLQAADVPLLAIVASASDEARDVLIRCALQPWHPRTLQELLNHAASRGPMLQAIRKAVDDGFRPDAEQTLLLVGLLAGWESEEASAVCAPLEDTHPWAVAYRALDDLDAIAALHAWLDAPTEAPASLGWRVVEVLSQRAKVEAWPLTRWVAHFDLPAQSFDAWGLDDDAVELLIERAQRFGGTEAQALEAWNAAGLLVSGNRHVPILGLLEAAVATDLPWDADFLARIAAGDPPVPGLAAAIAHGLAHHDDNEPALAVVEALPAADFAIVVEALLGHAARRPTTTGPAGPGVERVFHEGVDDQRLLALAKRTGDAALIAQAVALEAIVRPKS
jgi:hypothetical protein